jgi:formate-dependent nitrite reductase membrane component NrfD
MQPGLPGLCALLATLNLPLTLGTAVYTAFLFGQCEGRDLWQSPLLPLQLMVQMAVGAAAAGLLVSALPGTDLAAAPLAGGLVAALALHLLAVAAELGVPHASEQAARAAHAITHGRHRREFWIGGVAVGHAVPGVALLFGDPALIGAPAAVLALAGLYVYENVFVRAPQTLPNS